MTPEGGRDYGLPQDAAARAPAKGCNGYRAAHTQNYPSARSPEKTTTAIHARTTAIRAGGTCLATVAHWIAAAGLSLYTIAGLSVLTATSRLTDRGAAMTAWAVVALKSGWTLWLGVALMRD